MNPYDDETIMIDSTDEDSVLPIEAVQDNRDIHKFDSQTSVNNLQPTAVINDSIESAKTSFSNTENTNDDIMPDKINETKFYNFTTNADFENRNASISSKENSLYPSMDYSETSNIVQESYSNSDPYNVSSIISDPDYTATSMPSFNPSLDLTAEEELKMHMLFQVRVKVFDIYHLHQNIKHIL